MRNRCRNRMIAFLLISLVFLAGCRNTPNDLGIKAEGYGQLIKRVDQVSSSLSSKAAKAPVQAELEAAEHSARSMLAIHLADDMARAPFFDVMTEDMLVTAGEAVKAYPHPLLLNNYASMLIDVGKAEDALYFYLQALNQEPDQPVILTNIANVYIELDRLDEAQRYAELAARSHDQYGPAFQVLTTVHLANGDSELAAETMVKSTRNSFNEVTVHHFESFFDAVGELDPEQDEYPLKEPLLDELYLIARTNVDTHEVDGSTDTPAKQIRLKPFPVIAGGEHLMKMGTYLTEESGKLLEKWFQAQDESHMPMQAYMDQLYVEPEEGVYPVMKNIRQVYSYRLLESFYNYKLLKLQRDFMKAHEGFYNSYRERTNRIDELFGSRLTQSEEHWEQLVQQAEAELLAGKNPDPIIARINAAFIQVLQIRVQWEQERYSERKAYAESMTSAAKDYYNSSKIILEEFWLKAGGLMKYVVDNDAFEYIDALRKMVVFSFIGEPFQELATIAMELRNDKFALDIAEETLLAAKLNAAEMEWSGQDPYLEEEESGEELVPDIEKEAIETYPESSDTDDIGVEFGLFGHNVSAAYNGDAYELSGDTLLFGSASRQGSLSNPDEKKIVVLHGVKAEANTSWFTDTKLVSAVLDNAGKAGKAASKLGAIGFGFSNSERMGEYHTSKTGKGIIDRGVVYVRESGGEIGPFGRSEKVEVHKSYITGIAEKKKTIKYKFLFASITTRG
jgi:hypothetical protein